MNLETLCIRADPPVEKTPRKFEISQFPEMSKIADARLEIRRGKKGEQL